MDKQYEQIFCVTIIINCAILLFLPKMLFRPGLILTCLAFIGMSSFFLMVTWIAMLSNEFRMIGGAFLFLALLFILSNMFYCFRVVEKNQTKIQDENVHLYYEKFMMITIWLIFIELIFYYYLFYSILNGEKTGGLYISTIIFLCVLNFFVIRFNSIYFTYFSADG